MIGDAGHRQCPTCSGALTDDGLCVVCALSGNTAEARPAPASQISNLSAIQRFGPYDLLGEIGQEGVMGAVYQARQRSTDRIVALKMLRPARMRSAEMVDRFMREVRVMGSFDHRHILPIFETGEQDGAYFFTMKLALGGSLLWQMQQRSWTVPSNDPNEAAISQKRIANLLRSVASGVQHAHERGVLHRDLKPANILLDLDGSPFVADFGLAKHYHADLNVTHSMQVLGTPAYMAPEQAKEGGKHVTTATDVWSLGVILYELLVGDLPFDAENSWELLGKIQTQDPIRPRSLNPLIHPALERICLKCLQKNPSRRYHTPAEFGDALEAYLTGTLSVVDSPKAPKPKAEPEPTLPEPRDRGAIVGIFVGLAILIAAAFAFNQIRKSGGSSGGAGGGKTSPPIEKKIVVDPPPPPAPTGAIQLHYLHSLPVKWNWQIQRTDENGKTNIVRRVGDNISSDVLITNLPLGNYELWFGETETISELAWRKKPIRVDTNDPTVYELSLSPPRLKVIANHKAKLAIGLPSGLFIKEELSSVSPTNPQADWVWSSPAHWGRYNQKDHNESGEWRLIVSSERYNTIKQDVRVYAGITNEVRVTLTEWTVPHRGYDWRTTSGHRMMPIGRSFWAGEREVTVAEFREFAAEVRLARENFRVYKNFRWEPGPDSWDSLPDQDPVSGVTAIEADQFCEWLTRRERTAGRLSATQRYQLPTHEQWMALYDSSKTLWPADEEGLPPEPYVANLAGQELRQRLSLEVGRKLAPWTDGYPFAAPADGALAKPPYPSQGTYKLYHIVGNVAEWSADVDPSKPSKRLIHGGSWFDSSRDSFCRTCQIPVEATRRAANIGFRVILVDSDINSEEP